MGIDACLFNEDLKVKVWLHRWYIFSGRFEPNTLYTRKEVLDGLKKLLKEAYREEDEFKVNWLTNAKKFAEKTPNSHFTFELDCDSSNKWEDYPEVDAADLDTWTPGEVSPAKLNEFEQILTDLARFGYVDWMPKTAEQHVLLYTAVGKLNALQQRVKDEQDRQEALCPA